MDVKIKTGAGKMPFEAKYYFAKKMGE